MRTIFDCIDKPVYACLPCNLDLNEIFGPQPVEILDYARYFIDVIFKGTHFANRASTGGYVTLMVKYVRKVIPKALIRVVRDRLMTLGVIEMNRQYIPGERAMGYRLASRYRRSKHRRHVIRSDKVAERIRRAQAAQVNGMAEVHRYMLHQFRRVDINAHDMLRMIRHHENTLPSAKRGYCPTLYLAAEQLESGDWLPTVCQYGRFHTPLTRLLSDCRAALRIDGKRLVNIDIANSQPLFFWCNSVK